jgi:hypothetical protein
MPQHYVYRFYAELKDYSPKIWRRFEINGEKTMAELGYALMLMFEMQASHLFCFKENRKETLFAEFRPRCSDEEIERMWEELFASEPAIFRYELPFEEISLKEDEQLVEAHDIKLSQIIRSSGWKLRFKYDYGDGWEVALALENCERYEVSLTNLPCVLEGEGYGIIEDVGGVWGLKSLAKTLKKGKGREYDNFCAWLGTTTLDLKTFDIDDMNFRLKKLIRVYKDIYEYDCEPTKRMQGVLLREYKDKGPRGY